METHRAGSAGFALVVRLLVEGCRLLAAIFRPAMHYEAMPDDRSFCPKTSNSQPTTSNRTAQRCYAFPARRR